MEPGYPQRCIQHIFPSTCAFFLLRMGITLECIPETEVNFMLAVFTCIIHCDASYTWHMLLSHIYHRTIFGNQMSYMSRKLYIKRRTITTCRQNTNENKTSLTNYPRHCISVSSTSRPPHYETMQVAVLPRPFALSRSGSQTRLLLRLAEW